MAGNAPDLDPLDEAAVDALRAQGLVDIEEADSLDALKAVRGALLGDQAPLVIANRTMVPSSPPSAVWQVRTSDRPARR